MAGKEIELKLAVARSDLATLRAHQLVAGAAPQGRRQRLVSTYFDTPDRVLARHDMTLRIRRIGRRRIQTLKIGGGSGSALQDRVELEWPVAGDIPDLDLIEDEAVRAVVSAAAVRARLRPTVTTDVRREARRLAGASGGTILLAIDEGEVRADGGAREAISEVELELESGRPSDLFAIAQALADAVPIRLEERSKAARGAALLEPIPPRPVKGARPELPCDATLATAIAAVLEACCAQVIANRPAVLAGADPEGVHQMRVGLRRLRSALSLFRDVLDPAVAAPLAGEAKRLAAALAPAREWDVFLGETLAPLRAAFPGEAGLAELAAAAEARRQAGYEAARAAIAGPREARLLLDVSALAARLADIVTGPDPLATPARDYAEACLDRVYRKASRLGRRIAELDFERRHELRIRLKRLRYAGEFFASLYGRKASARFLRLLEPLQDILGVMNDFAVAVHHVTTLTGEASPALGRAAGLVLGWHGQARQECEAQLGEAWRRFARVAPFWR